MTDHAIAGGGAVDAYIATFPPPARQALKELRALVLATAPGANERLGYGIISYGWQGRDLVYFGGWQRHIGFYPVTQAVAEAFGDELKPYKSGKGSLRFLLGHPLPVDLVRRIVQCRLDEVAAARTGPRAGRLGI